MEPPAELIPPVPGRPSLKAAVWQGEDSIGLPPAVKDKWLHHERLGTTFRDFVDEEFADMQEQQEAGHAGSGTRQKRASDISSEDIKEAKRIKISKEDMAKKDMLHEAG